jgi:hypothetical protein
MTAFRNWYPQLSDWTECNAYRREVGCLSAFIGANCDGNAQAAAGAALGGIFGGLPGAILGYLAGAVSPECCATLRRELEFARRQQRSHCAAARNVPCPFRADGTII